MIPKRSQDIKTDDAKENAQLIKNQLGVSGVRA